MTLLEMKKKILRLIEEIGAGEKSTDDPDIEAKLNDVINQIQFELARMKKIPVITTKTITESDLEFELNTLGDFYQLDRVIFKDLSGDEFPDVEIFGNYIVFPEAGTAKIYYFKYPKRITDDTRDDEYKFELSDDALEILPYGVAADLLKSDVSNNYGEIYSKRYETMLQRLDPRYSMGSIYIDGGIDV